MRGKTLLDQSNPYLNLPKSRTPVGPPTIMNRKRNKKQTSQVVRRIFRTHTRRKIEYFQAETTKIVLLHGETTLTHMYMKVSRPGPRPRRQNPQTLRNAAVSVTGKHSIECLLCPALNPSIGDGAAESPLAARVVRGSSDKLGVRCIAEVNELLPFLGRFLVAMSRPMALPSHGSPAACVSSSPRLLGWELGSERRVGLRRLRGGMETGRGG
jgi:hypothetical protein